MSIQTVTQGGWSVGCTTGTNIDGETGQDLEIDYKQAEADRVARINSPS